MPPHMIAIVPYVNATHHVRHLHISVPLVECLVDGVRYFRPDEAPPLPGQEPAAKPKPPTRPERRWR